MSSYLYSKIDSIHKLTFEPLRARVVKVIKACNINGTTVILGANGVIYCSGIKNRLAYSFTPRSLENALQACIKMGLLSDKAVQQHLDEEKERWGKSKRGYAAKEIVDAAKCLGIKLTKSQQAKIDLYAR